MTNDDNALARVIKATNVSKGIGKYLDAVDTGTASKRGVSLGAIGNGLPAWTSNPDDVEQAIKLMRERATIGTAVQRLKRTQRVIELERSLESLRDEGGGVDEVQSFFVEHAHAWATEHRIGYAAFRAMGVPVAVLNEADIDRTFEP